MEKWKKRYVISCTSIVPLESETEIDALSN